MTTVHHAAFVVAEESFAMLRDAVAGLPNEALDWKPAPESNSLNVLVLHSISATKFWMAAGAGAQRSIADYRESERAPAFEAKGRSAAELEAAINTAIEDLKDILSKGTEEHLVAEVSWPEDPSMTKTGARGLFHAIAHLREHVGHAQSVRDLWLARS
jgi:uncharacterized damage-inducible protein DinB